MYHLHDIWEVTPPPKNIQKRIILESNQECANDWWFMVFNPTFNNISVISWRSVLLVQESGVPGEKHLPVANH